MAPACIYNTWSFGDFIFHERKLILIKHHYFMCSTRSANRISAWKLIILRAYILDNVIMMVADALAPKVHYDTSSYHTNCMHFYHIAKIHITLKPMPIGQSDV